jgi:hypothetical protein
MYLCMFINRSNYDKKTGKYEWSKSSNIATTDVDLFALITYGKLEKKQEGSSGDKKLRSFTDHPLKTGLKGPY